MNQVVLCFVFEDNWTLILMDLRKVMGGLVEHIQMHWDSPVGF